MHSSSCEKGSLSVSPVKVAEAFERYPEMRELAEQYAAESASPELQSVGVQIAQFTALEQAGVGFGYVLLSPAGVRGFLFLLVCPSQHQAAPIATVQSIFAVEGGHMLIQQAKNTARQLGADALQINAPVGGRLARRMARDRSARHSHEVYLWAL